ncbi:AAA family ATPase [Actinoplanes sp. CA-030573]|uniref:AAA family ATPase n=1 Tax=Actinoplanes sp. CA-030573 TaxID=3239898 RepID=UPI003D8C4B4D
MSTGYRPIFDPDRTGVATRTRVPRHRADTVPESGYVYDVEGRIAFAVNVAIVTGRPLLIRGKPGTGKTSLAADVAERMNWQYYEHVTTSRTRAADLLWSFDAVRRLSDASGGGAGDPLDYVVPGPLWWGLAPAKAASRGLTSAQLAERGLDPVPDPSPRTGKDAVVLIDEIDKADPDVPNDLLLPLGALRFPVTDVGGPPLPVDAERSPLVMITTNEERDLAPAFLRRCVVLRLPHPLDDRLASIAAAHFGAKATPALIKKVLKAYHAIRETRGESGHEPNPAEFLDAVAAAISLQVRDSGGQRWDQLMEFALRKPPLEPA